MISRNRRPVAGNLIDRTSAEPLPEGPTMTLDEFWDAMADAVEAMSHEELRAELMPLKAQLTEKLH
jgi:hypothetical protein